MDWFGNIRSQTGTICRHKQVTGRSISTKNALCDYSNWDVTIGDWLETEKCQKMNRFSVLNLLYSEFLQPRDQKDLRRNARKKITLLFKCMLYKLHTGMYVNV